MVLAQYLREASHLSRHWVTRGKEGRQQTSVKSYPREEIQGRQQAQLSWAHQAPPSSPCGLPLIILFQLKIIPWSVPDQSNIDNKYQPAMNMFATSPEHSFQHLRFVIIINNIISDRKTSNLGNFIVNIYRAGEYQNIQQGWSFIVAERWDHGIVKYLKSLNSS